MMAMMTTMMVVIVGDIPRDNWGDHDEAQFEHDSEFDDGYGDYDDGGDSGGYTKR